MCDDKRHAPSETVDDDEELFRGIPPVPSHWKTSEDRPSSAVFKDKNGLSVDRDGDREDDQIVSVLEDRWSKNHGAVAVTAESCRETEAVPVGDPIDGNPYHGLVYGSGEKHRNSDVSNRGPTSSQAYALIEACRYVKRPDT